MKKYFNTKEKADKHLEYRRKCAYERIKKSGDEILSDASFVYKNEEGKWVVFIQIFSRKLLSDLTKIPKERFTLIPFSPAEKIIKEQNRIKELERKYKTLDIEDYTINNI